ncbi:uncharacterized protein PHACADRAFT_212042 [Phanerochaete carnosa HHB-10118-sp]|uniref:RRM domain-containing protein n=1 Tax=Phanerochaete carnosa (strain HHB-10118-sp) TaxID=650164 RepID=K5USH1_PHACS|nr:uncharacterized protein PHACADRAFT_212042 [Phanerochaete carnosa HHB-10118-sp]EKM52836.1 hypothetical protein PHACADRAFT_212042 [Phanerochaete carnosa HHB-10118-sp]
MLGGKDEDEVKSLRARTVLHLQGLSSGTTSRDVRAAFDKFGPIKAVVMNKDIEGSSKADSDQAYIEFNLADDASKAFDASIFDGLTVRDAPVKAEFFKSSLDTMIASPTIHITGLSQEATLADLSELFERYAVVVNVRFGRHPGTAFVDFRSAESASFVVDAHRARPFELGDDSAPSLAFAAPSVGLRKFARPAEPPAELQPSHPTIFATKFGRPVSEEILRRVFCEHGEITDVTRKGENTSEMARAPD